MLHHFAFLFIGGAHHFLHMAPAAASLSQHDDVAVTAYVAQQEDIAPLSDLLGKLGGEKVRIVPLNIPSFFSMLGKLIPSWSSWKLIQLLWWSGTIRKADAIVTAERTSTILKRLPGYTPPIYHIPHGAGDRAKGFERRISLFDHVLVAGPKDRDRMIAEGLLAPDQVSVTGSIKLSGIRRMHQARPFFFDNDRPIVLYNPHFDQSLASWDSQARDLIDRIAQDGRYNLIVAPHVRLFETASNTDRIPWLALAKTDQILVDLGSERSSDMSYTRAADIYIGDVSSQVYEFLSEPRPAIFVNAHHVSWKDDENYRMWHFGDVIEETDAILPALDRATSQHAHYRPIQEEAVTRALGNPNEDAGEKAADTLLQLVRQQPTDR